MNDAMSSPLGKVLTETAEQTNKPGLEFRYEDLREWIAQAEKFGEIRHVKGANRKALHQRA